MNLRIFENVPLAPFTTLGVGGAARFMAVIEDENQIAGALSFARKHDCPVFILGGGSNLVVADTGFPGLALKIEISGIQPTGEKRGVISVGAGVTWDDFVRYCVDHNLAGNECLSGIPGTVGGVPIQNVGAYGQEAGETIVSARVWDRESEKIVDLSNQECAFAYRSSVFNTSDAGRHIVLRVKFNLHYEGTPRVQYADLRRHFAGKPAPSLRQVRNAVIDLRKAKGMFVSTEDPDSKSAGSFFRNPVISPADFSAMKQRAMDINLENIPCFDTPEGDTKLSAAWLIEHSGIYKGYVHNGAGVSGKHALALINRGNASAKDIIELMEIIRQRVMETFGVDLRPEPVFLGFDAQKSIL